jgi:hypothetical protein
MRVREDRRGNAAAQAAIDRDCNQDRPIGINTYGGKPLGGRSAGRHTPQRPTAGLNPPAKTVMCADPEGGRNRHT